VEYSFWTNKRRALLMDENITVTEVTLHWIEKWSCYLLATTLKDDIGGLTLQEIEERADKPLRFWSCLGVLMRFPHRDKLHTHKYRITIEDLGIRE
jgi:hypothetical protein